MFKSIFRWLKRQYERIDYAITLKYFKKIEHASPAPAAIFDLSASRSSGWLTNIRGAISDRVLLAVLWFFREFWPNPQIGRLLLVTRFDDVKQVLTDEDHFTVPFGKEMEALAGANSVLGLDGAEHTRLNEIIQAVLLRQDMGDILASTRKVTLNLIATSGGRIDAVRDVITRVSTETCSEYFGLHIEDHDAFGEWSIASSTLLFADPFGSEETRRNALAAAALMRPVMHRAIRRARREYEQDMKTGQPRVKQTVAYRLERLQAEKTRGTLEDKDICGLLMSLVTGFVPTNTLAAGKILQELLRRPRRMEEARMLAVQGDKDKLRGMLLEASRFNAALSPGQWRYASKEQTIAAGTSRSKKVRVGTVLLVATRSALRDRRAIDRPSEFRPDRKRDPNVMFGFGPHKCLGEHIATEHILEIFSVLLAQPNLQRAAGRHGQFAWVGPFPERLDMEFGDSPSAPAQSMLTIAAPLKPGSKSEEVERMIRDLEKPGDLKRALEDTKIVHFASLAVIEAGNAAKPEPYVLLELNVDGTPQSAIPVIARATEAQFGRIFDRTQSSGSGLAEVFANSALDLRTLPWSAIGLNFNGTPEFPAVEIDMQHSLAKFAREALEFFIELKSGIGNRALPAVRFIRGLIRKDDSCFELARNEADKSRIRALMDTGAQFKDHLVLPGRKRLLISEWTERTQEDAIYHFLKSWDFWRPAIPVVVFALLMAVGIFITIEHALTGWFRLPYQIVISLVGGIAAAALLVAATAVTFLFVLRYYERTDIPDDRDPDLEHMRRVTERENLPGFAQNHFIAVTALKRGRFRKLTLALSLWGIKQLVKHAYRPGFVLNMGTIHYAKWFRMPHTDKLIFLANYDGSWESYLEDFVMKAHAGQTAAWSNGVGFPKTKLLVLEGAQDGDRFKRWVRRQQVPTQFWYSRYPELTTDEIRNNAVIHQGLVRAFTDTAAMSWLDCFGSMQRPDHTIEADEVQSLMFRGFKHSEFARYALVKLPDDPRRCAAWLEAILPGKVLQDGSRDFDVAKEFYEIKGKGALASGVHVAEADVEATKLLFGDYTFRADAGIENLATFVAFSARGLRKLGLPAANKEGGVAGLAGAFNIGMVNRRRILGDRDDARWRWWDGDDDASDPRVADAILIVLGKTSDQCTKALKAHRRILGDDIPGDSAVIHEVCSEVIKKDSGFAEHFGFRDGVSQPIIRGTQRSVEGVADDRDVVEAGEFILGYRNNQGYYPPAITVSAETDLSDRLPEVIADSPPPFPSFRTARSGLRDFGRNGSYLVVREIEQHVKRFDAFTTTTADKLRRTSDRLPMNAGAPINAEWVAAKMMGRWKTGAPLALRPGVDNDGKPPPFKKEEANNFTYADDDPQGLRCPFGAHIRRANPRDGLRPGDKLQQSITNRHRLLRRGRTYQTQDKQPENGLMFTCLCADLERQFEFVQQTWIGSRSFHGLTGEIDPVIGAHDPSKERNVFTIPTPSGPVTLDGLESFVTVHAGGYFFMPSYSALLYLWDLNLDKAGLPAR